MVQQSDDFHIINSTLVKSDIHRIKHQHLSSLADLVKSSFDPLLQQVVGLNATKCSTLWLTALPIEKQVL